MVRARWLFVPAAMVISLFLALGLTRPSDEGIPAQRSSVQKLMRALRRQDTRYGKFRLSTWNALPAKIQQLVPQLQPIPSRTIRLRACASLVNLGPEAVDAVPDLTKTLNDPVMEIRVEAAHALSAIVRAASDAKVPLLRVLADPA